MNGSDTNTRGTEVLQLAMLPAGAIPGIVTYLEGVAARLRTIDDGTGIPVALDFSEKDDNDRIPDDVFAEITRRLIATVDKGTEGTLIYAVAAPDDHTKGWQPIDPVTSLPIGQYKIWNADKNEWETAAIAGGAVYVPPKEVFTTVAAAPGNSTVNVNFDDFKTTKYSVTLTPTTFSAGAYLTAPGSLPSGHGAIVINKSNAQLTLAFFGMPDLGGGVGPLWEVWIRATPV